jgi:hypothetical protein
MNLGGFVLELLAVVGHALFAGGHELAVRWHRKRWRRRWDWASVLHRALVYFSVLSLINHAARLLRSISKGDPV